MPNRLRTEQDAKKHMRRRRKRKREKGGKAAGHATDIGADAAAVAAAAAEPDEAITAADELEAVQVSQPTSDTVRD